MRARLDIRPFSIHLGELSGKELATGLDPYKQGFLVTEIRQVELWSVQLVFLYIVQEFASLVGFAKRVEVRAVLNRNVR